MTRPRARDIFADAIELTAEERRAYLDQACSSDTALRQEVESLLAAHTRAGSFLEAIPWPPASGTPERGDADRIGPESTVGVYRIEATLGEGGMGRVFLAHRADAEYEQQVAVKIVKRGLDTDRLLQRFRTERQVLANLSHPNIARLLDGGATADGRPYLVMEYVRGLPLDRYCTEHRLDIEQRLRLFLHVCDAVSYAHRNLVIHRDLKPSNVLIGDDGRVKLLDFGIAKVLSEEVGAEAAGTVTELRAMTPRYASPEQVAGEPVTTASDVYSLGVLLYEILIGCSPYGITSSGLELEREIREREPTRPSTALARRALEPEQQAEVEEIAANRQSTPRELRRRLDGDLDTIVLHCLRKEPERRYGSVEQLALDLRRHLDGRPIAAQPPRFTYVAKKFVRRNRLLVTAAAAVILAIAVGAAGLVIGLERALDSAREEARQRRVAEAVNAFVNEDLLASIDPENTADPDITMREVVDRAAERLRSRRAGDPLVDAAIRVTLGSLYQSLGELDLAREYLEAAVEGSRALAGPDHRDTQQALRMLGDLELRAGRLKEAEAIYRDALRTCERVFGPDDLTTLEMVNSLGLSLTEQGRYEEAEPLYRGSARRLEAEYGAEHQSTMTAKSNLAQLLSYTDRLEESEILYLELEDQQRKVLGNEHPDVIATLNNLGFAYIGMNRYDEAKERFREASELAEKVLGPEHPHTLMMLSNLGLPDAYRGNFDNIEELWLEVLEARRRKLGPDHPDLLNSLNNVAFMYRSQGRLEEAEPLAVEAVAARRRTLGDRHPSTLNSTNNLGLLYEDMGRYDDARELYLETLALRREVLGPGAEPTLITQTNLGRLERKRGNVERSREVLAETFAALQEAAIDDTTSVAIGVRSEYGQSLLAAGDEHEGVRLLTEAWKGAAAHPQAAQGAAEIAAILASHFEGEKVLDEASLWRSRAAQ